MYILIVEYCFYTLWIYLGCRYGLPLFGKYFLDSGSDKYGERND
ncbi:hypothetical protein EJP02_484 [Escherichia phage EJP2]|nr:hypothetical protein EJP02_484 [Escherichia phage EJP2]